MENEYIMLFRRALEKLANLAKAANMAKVAIMAKVCQGCRQSVFGLFFNLLIRAPENCDNLAKAK